jgi:predicted nucleic acid-binding protein
LNVFFVDTSALGRRYLVEVGSAWVLTWITPAAGNIIVVADLAPVEMFSVFARRQREGTLLVGSVPPLQSNLMLHMEKEYLSVALDAPVLIEARRLVSYHKLRTLDAIQLACALRAKVQLNDLITFICSDNDLLAAASAEGFATDNPYLHP